MLIWLVALSVHFPPLRLRIILSDENFQSRKLFFKPWASARLVLLLPFAVYFPLRPFLRANLHNTISLFRTLISGLAIQR